MLWLLLCAFCSLLKDQRIVERPWSLCGYKFSAHGWQSFCSAIQRLTELPLLTIAPALGTYTSTNMRVSNPGRPCCFSGLPFRRGEGPSETPRPRLGWTSTLGFFSDHPRKLPSSERCCPHGRGKEEDEEEEEASPTRNKYCRRNQCRWHWCFESWCVKKRALKDAVARKSFTNAMTLRQTKEQNWREFEQTWPPKHGNKYKS